MVHHHELALTPKAEKIERHLTRRYIVSCTVHLFLKISTLMHHSSELFDHNITLLNTFYGMLVSIIPDGIYEY